MIHLSIHHHQSTLMGLDRSALYGTQSCHNCFRAHKCHSSCPLILLFKFQSLCRHSFFPPTSHSSFNQKDQVGLGHINNLKQLIIIFRTLLRNLHLAYKLSWICYQKNSLECYVWTFIIYIHSSVGFSWLC